MRIFPLVSSSHGILSHLVVRDNMDQYLRVTKEMAKTGKGAAGSSLTWVFFSLGKAKIPRDFGQGMKGWAQLLSLSALEERQAAVSVGRIHHHCGVLAPDVSPYREWNFAHEISC